MQTYFVDSIQDLWRSDLSLTSDKSLYTILQGEVRMSGVLYSILSSFFFSFFILGPLGRLRSEL